MGVKVEGVGGRDVEVPRERDSVGGVVRRRWRMCLLGEVVWMYWSGGERC